MTNQIRPYELFSEQVSKNKNNIAVSDITRKITYAELDEKISQFCDLLVKNHIDEKDYFAIALLPSIEYVTAILSCFKLNIRFIPLDLSHPNAYLKKIINDASVKFIITIH